MGQVRDINLTKEQINKRLYLNLEINSSEKLKKYFALLAGSGQIISFSRKSNTLIKLFFSILLITVLILIYAVFQIPLN